MRVKSQRTPIPQLLAVLVLLPSAAHTHSKLLSPTPRVAAESGLQDTLDGGGLNFNAPCGPENEVNGIPPGPPVVSWVSGSNVTLEFDQVIDHGDEQVQFFYSTDGVNFTELSAPSGGARGAVDYVQGGLGSMGEGQHSVRVGLPDLGATTMVLRYTDGQYFSCADVSLTEPVVFSDGFESGGLEAWQ